MLSPVLLLPDERHRCRNNTIKFEVALGWPPKLQPANLVRPSSRSPPASSFYDRDCGFVTDLVGFLETTARPDGLARQPEQRVYRKERVLGRFSSFACGSSRGRQSNKGDPDGGGRNRVRFAQSKRHLVRHGLAITSRRIHIDVRLQAAAGPAAGRWPGLQPERLERKTGPELSVQNNPKLR